MMDSYVSLIPDFERALLVPFFILFHFPRLDMTFVALFFLF
jgi:hypothetical protein